MVEKVRVEMLSGTYIFALRKEGLLFNTLYRANQCCICFLISYCDSERDSLCKKITGSFTDELLLYQSAVQDFKNELKERLTKQIQSIKPKTDDDFVDMSIRSESRKSALFREIMALGEEELSEEDAR